MRFERSIGFVMLACGLSGCCTDLWADEAAPPPPPPTSDPTAEPSTEVDSPTGPVAAAGSGADRGAQPLEGSITLEMLDIQLFHPSTRRRLMADARSPDENSAELGGGFGVGVLVSARNDSGYILGTPRILSDVVVTGTHGGAGCRVVPRRRSYWSRTASSLTVVSPQRSDRTPWADESGSAYELVWRPQETIRIRAVLECGPIHLQDIVPTGLSGSFAVAATAPFAEHEVACDNDYDVCGDDVAGRSAQLSLPARAFSLATVQLPYGGAGGYLAGDIFVRADQGRVSFESIADHGSSAFSAPTGDLPATPVAVRDSLDEWSLTIAQVNVQHWTDVPTAPKGSRLVTVQATVAVDSGAIEGRLRGAIDTARTVDAAAQQALVNAQAASAAAPDDPTASATLRAAESAARTSASGISRAQSSYDRAIGTERSRLSRLLACDRVQLVTHHRLQRAVNGREMAATCSLLSTADSVSVSWLFLVDRYEIPVGITYTVGRDPHTAFFAAQSLSTFDPR